MSKMPRKRPPASEPKIDNTRLKHLWGTRRFSEGLVRLGTGPAIRDLQLFPLVTHSLHVRRCVESINDEDSEASPLVIDLSDCPGDLDVFKMVEYFCLGLMDEKDISVSNVVKVLATSNFLEMDSLTLRASKFLEESVFNSWEGCLSVLATFNDCHIAREDPLFSKCEEAFVQQIGVNLDPPKSVEYRMSCSMQCLVRVAELLPRNAANRVYQSCRVAKLGIFHNLSSPQISIPLSTLVREDHTLEGALPESFEPLPETGVQYIEGLACALPDWLRRSVLVLHLAKSMHLENDINLPDRNIHHSILRWDFLSALLVEAVELSTTSEGSAHATRRDSFVFANYEFEDNVDEEIENLERLVGCGLREGSHWSSAEDPSVLLLQQDLVLETLKKFKFENLIQVVRHFRYSGSNHLHISAIAKILDACLGQHLKEKTFTVQQALGICKVFPNDSRSSHAGIYHVFEDNLERKALSPQEVLDLTKLLDYEKLSDEIVEKLMGELQFDCDPRLRERFILKPRGPQNDQEKSKEDLIKLRNEYNAQAADLMEVRRDLEEEQEKATCQICFSRPRDALSLPCGHLLYCSECLWQHHQRSKTCPTCRGATTGMINCILKV